MPAIGFVNENKLYAGENVDEAQIDLAEMWLDAGLELGNHTYSHRSLNTISLMEYEADFLQGESITKDCLRQSGIADSILPHPYLQTGRTLADQDGFRRFSEAARLHDRTGIDR